MAFNLRIDIPGLARIHYVLKGTGPWTLGSGESCHIPVKARGVSRRHLEIELVDDETLLFHDLGSTNGTYLDNEKVDEGVLSHGRFLQVGEVVMALEDTGTDEYLYDPELKNVSISSTVDLRVLSGQYPGNGSAERMPFLGLVSLMEEVAKGKAEGQHLQSLTKIFSEVLGCLSAKCYRFQENRLTLHASSGEFPDEVLPPSLARVCARIPKTVTFDIPKPDGGKISAVSIPVQLPGNRVIMIGVLPDEEDLLRTRMDKLLALPVLFKFVLQWIGDLEHQASTMNNLRREFHSLSASGGRSLHGVEPILGKSTDLIAAIKLSDRFAPTDLTVLLRGPTGSGKELFARRIHALSDRSPKPMIAVNCSSIPETLLESELFGAVRGAYTGISNNRKGYFEAADGGTLFLDEIADLPMSLQPKLLRVLEEKKITPLGSTRSKPVDVRILAATNQHLEKLISGKAFRSDLYYRLAGMTVDLPPLKDRTGDVVLLATAFLERANREFKRSIVGFEEDAIRVLESHDWPGNVRELQAVVKRLVITTRDSVISSELVKSILGSVSNGEHMISTEIWGMSWQEAKDAFEKEFFTRRIKGNGKNASALAAELKISRPSFYLKLKKLGIDPSERCDKH